jgi:hypothetical protein
MTPLLVYLPEVLAEGLLFIRRALTIYRIGHRIASASDAIDTLTIDQIRHHQSVIGDDLYLFLIGRLSVENVRRTLSLPPLPKRSLDYIALSALVNPTYTRTSPDVSSKVLGYLQALGQEWQVFDHDCYDQLVAYINAMDVNVVIEDPVYEYFKNLNSVPGELDSLAKDLGASEPELKVILSGIKDNVRTERWTRSISDAEARGQSIYKMHTAFAIMATGARVELPKGEAFLSTTSDVPQQTLNLNSSFLMKAVNPTSHTAVFPDMRSITKEMVDQASREVMTHKGYVEGERGRFEKLEKSTLDKDEDGASSIFVSQLTGSASDELAARAETKARVFSRLNKIKATRNSLK